MKIKLLIITIIIVVGCSQNRIISEYKKQTDYTDIEVPNWLLQIPDGYEIGISKIVRDTLQYRNAAKEFAAVMKSRNNSSYAIYNFAQHNTESLLKNKKAELKINVSSNPEKAHEFFKSMQLLNSNNFYGYFIGLFACNSNNQTLISEKFIEIQPQKPEWFKNNIEIDNSIVYANAKASSSNLIDAWQKAAEHARLNIARYKQKDVKGMINSNNKKTDRIVAVETSKKISNLNIVKSHIIKKLIDSSLTSYEVFLQVKVGKI